MAASGSDRTDSRPASETRAATDRLGDLPGGRIVAASWLSTIVFSVTAFGDRFGVDAFEAPAQVTALILFGAGVVIWTYAFVRAVMRSTESEIGIAGLFFLAGVAPRPVQIQLLGSLVVAVGVAAATASQAPFGVLEPVLPMALNGLWAARHGDFPPRRVRATQRSGQ